MRARQQTEACDIGSTYSGRSKKIV